MRRSARFVLTLAARDDLADLSAYIRQDNPQEAVRVRAELRDAMRRLARMPLAGHRREDLTDQPVRFWSVYSYIIVYDPDTQPLQIIRILHSARDVRRILG